MKYIAKNLTFCGVLVAVFCIFGMFSSKAEALTDAPITNSAPIVASSNINGNGVAKMQPWFAVGTGAFDGAVSYAKIYVLNNTTATFTIQQAPCADDLGTPDVTYAIWKLDTAESFAGAQPYGTTYHRTGTQNCTLGDITYTLVADNAHSTYIGHEAYNVFMLDVEMAPIAGDNSHSFRAHVNGNNYVGVSAPIRNFGANSWFGIFQHDSVGKANWDYAVQFAPNCAQDPVDTPERVNIYDIDAGVFNQPSLQSYVKQDVKGNTFNWVNSVDGFSDPAGNPQPNGNATYAHRSITDPQARYRFVLGNHSRNDLSYISNYQNKYKLYFYDFWFDNTIQITLPYDQFNSMLPAGTCPANPPTNGDLSAASCTQITGHAWFDENDTTTATFGRLHIYTASDPVGVYTGQFGTTSQAHSAGGHSFEIDPYRYSASAPPGPTIDVLLNYHTRYIVQLQVPDGSGGWRDATNTAGAKATLNLQYPCITGNIGASCTNVSGDLTYRWNAPGNSTFAIHSIQGANNGTGNNFQAHYGYGHAGDLKPAVDPFKSSDAGIQNAPHLAATLQLYFLDTDGSRQPTYKTDGTTVVSTTLPPCLTWTCTPSPITFEVGSETTQPFTLRYNNNTQDVIPGYTGNLTSTNTIRIRQGGAPGTGPIPSSNGGVAVGTNLLTWPSVTVSSTGPNYTGDVVAMAYYGGTQIDASKCVSSASQVTKPYFKAYGASVTTGGDFAPSNNPTSSSCTSTNTGGVKAFARFNPSTESNPNNYVKNAGKFGASVEYSIQSLGLVDANNSAGLGFYSGDTHDSADDYVNTLDIGDQTPPSGGWGGNLGGFRCLEDYYDANLTGRETNWTNQNVATMFNSATTHPDDNNNVIGAQAFKASPGLGQAINLAGGSNLPMNTRVTLFVDGDVYISSDIRYTTGISYNPANASTIPPYFTLIASGSIYVGAGVTHLDGLYIAQGQNGTKDGFSTCGDISANIATNMPKNRIASECNQQLVVNGAVVAYQLKLLRIGDPNSTLSKANSDNGSTARGLSDNAVEEFNYTPAMMESFPYYMSANIGNGLGAVEKTFSLPPIY